MTARIDLYADVTARICDALDQGPEPWRKFWESSASLWHPTSHASGRPYRGINVLLLARACAQRGHALNRWLTFQQARALGGCVRRGSKAVPVVLWKPVTNREKDDATKDAASEEEEEQGAARVVIRQFHLFNVADCDGLPEAVHHAPAGDSLAERIVQRAGVQIIPGEPCYRPDQDVVQLPAVDAFESREAYFAAAFHELVHATARHVGREKKALRFGDAGYAMEELVAELGSAMLCGACGFRAVARTTSYLHHWLGVLRADKRAIFTVAAAAQTAADYLLNRAEVELAAAE